jgi:hypothetical protein
MDIAICETLSIDVNDDAVAFINDGLIDTLAIATFGISAKVTDNPIGFFGTGLKYAIAVLLRHGHEITIWRGSERLDFAVADHESRGKTFGIVTMNGQALGFTTDLGKQWEMWQALRELWCNCADEGGEAFSGRVYSPEDGKTAIVVRGAEFAKAFKGRSEYILSTNPLHVLHGVEIHPGRSRTIFYRGIAVGRLPENKTPIHTYNITRYVGLTEDRTVRYSHQIDEAIAEAYQKSDNIDLIEAAIRAPNNSLERQLDYSFHATKPTEAFVETVNRIQRTHSRDMNQSARAQASAHTALPPIREYILTPIEREQYAAAKAFLLALGYDTEVYPTCFVEKLGNGILGTASGGEISISRDAFTAGTKQLAITLLEEFIHCFHGVGDETRAMQETLLHELVSLGEKHILGGAL